jgi:hypothetical protein
MIIHATSTVKALTNQEYFLAYCYVTDLPRIMRMWNRHLDNTIGQDAPMYEKEQEYERWLRDVFDGSEWEAAKTKDDTEHWW